MKAMLILIVLMVPAATAAADFYPACLKRDGDWLHGVREDECRSLGGVWHSGKAKRRK
jgi:hypothetical protein